jgi:hypothetical protein
MGTTPATSSIGPLAERAGKLTGRVTDLMSHRARPSANAGGRGAVIPFRGAHSGFDGDLERAIFAAP